MASVRGATSSSCTAITGYHVPKTHEGHWLRRLDATTAAAAAGLVVRPIRSGAASNDAALALVDKLRDADDLARTRLDGHAKNIACLEPGVDIDVLVESGVGVRVGDQHGGA